MQAYEIEYLKLPNGNSPLTEWLDSLDGSFRKRLNQRRFDFGKGYRIYYTEINGVIVLLINGGDKSDQSNDIVRAQKLLDEWRLSQ